MAEFNETDQTNQINTNDSIIISELNLSEPLTSLQLSNCHCASQEIRSLRYDVLLLKPLSDYAKEKYKSKNASDNKDSGYDMYYCDETITIEPWKTARLGLGVACAREVDIGYDLRARSSIDKTNLILSNGMGLIDCTYRGEIKASVRNVTPEPYTVEKGARLFQLALPGLESFTVDIVDSLSETSRGSGGFGSTGTH